MPPKLDSFLWPRWVSEHLTPFKGSLSDLQQPWGINRSRKSRIESPGWYSANIHWCIRWNLHCITQSWSRKIYWIGHVDIAGSGQNNSWFFFPYQKLPAMTWKQTKSFESKDWRKTNSWCKGWYSTKKLIFCPWKIVGTGRKHAGFLFWRILTPFWGHHPLQFQGVGQNHPSLSPSDSPLARFDCGEAKSN